MLRVSCLTLFVSNVRLTGRFGDMSWRHRFPCRTLGIQGPRNVLPAPQEICQAGQKKGGHFGQIEPGRGWLVNTGIHLTQKRPRRETFAA